MQSFRFRAPHRKATWTRISYGRSHIPRGRRGVSGDCRGALGRMDLEAAVHRSQVEFKQMVTPNYLPSLTVFLSKGPIDFGDELGRPRFKQLPRGF